jgi:DnaB-like helicase C terminal domain
MNISSLIHRAVGQLDNWYTFRRSPALSAPRGYLVDGRNVDAEWVDRFPTALPHRLALRAALERGKSVAMMSLVAPPQAVCMRLFLTRAAVPLERVRRGAIGDREFPRLVRASSELVQAQIEFVDVEELAPQRPYGGLTTALKHFSPELLVVMSAESDPQRLNPEAVRQFAALRGCRALHFNS